MAKRLREVVAENIRKYRVRSGLTQVELAKKAKLTDVYISRIEQSSKNITLDSLEQIASALGVPVVHMIEGVKAPLPKLSSDSYQSIRHAIKVLEAYLETSE